MTTREEVFKYIEKKYGAKPEYLWKKFPSYAVFRHKENKKWFAIIMSVEKEKLGLKGDGETDIINLKNRPLFIFQSKNTPGILPAYHMNKTNWLSVILNEHTSEKFLFELIDASFSLTE